VLDAVADAERPRGAAQRVEHPHLDVIVTTSRVGDDEAAVREGAEPWEAGRHRAEPCRVGAAVRDRDDHGIEGSDRSVSSQWAPPNASTVLCRG
jgi:hypothetical protein